jgi:hypothetical protein
MIRLSVLVASLILLVSGQMPSTTDWRGLSPLKSTRMDVERTLGAADQKIDKEQMTYYLPDVVVVFYFQGNPKCQQKLPYTTWDVTTDTVTAIDVTLKHPPLVSEAGIDLTKFEKTKGDYDVVDHYYYWKPEDGFAVEVGNKYVGGYLYRPGSKQSHTQCLANREVH